MFDVHIQRQPQSTFKASLSLFLPPLTILSNLGQPTLHNNTFGELQILNIGIIYFKSFPVLLKLFAEDFGFDYSGLNDLCQHFNDVGEEDED